MLADLLEGFEGFGPWALGIGIAILAGRPVARAMRPIAKGAIKGCLAIKDGAEQVTHQAREGLQDLVAEVRSEQAAPKSGAEA